MRQNADFERCFATKIKMSDLYGKCKWGLLLPWDRDHCGEYSISDLLNLYSSKFLYPYFHVYDIGPAAFMYYNRAHSRRLHLDQDQNQSHAFASQNFFDFFSKMHAVTPYLQSDRSKTCDWEYDDCNLYLANGLFQDLEIYQSKNPEKAGREYADITMILELLTITKHEREKSSIKPSKTKVARLRKFLRSFLNSGDRKLTNKIKNRASVILSLSGKRKEDLWNCLDQRGNYLHGEFVQEVLDVLKDECAEIRGTAHFDSSPSLRLVDFEFAEKCTRYTRFVVVALFYLQNHYRGWLKEHGGFAKLANSAISDRELRELLQSRTIEILGLLPDFQTQ